MSVKKKPLVVVTRKLPDSIETRMRELFDARLNLDDTPMTPEQIADAVRTADVLVPTVTDEITERFSTTPSCKVRLIANFGNGVDNIDVDRGACARHHRDQHPEGADRRHRRHDHGADPGGAAPADRGRRRSSPRARTGRAGRRPGCSAIASAANASASSAWAASARRWRAGRAPSGCRSTTTTAAPSRP